MMRDHITPHTHSVNGKLLTFLEVVYSLNGKNYDLLSRSIYI